MATGDGKQPTFRAARTQRKVRPLCTSPNGSAFGIHTSQGAHAAHIARGRLVRAAARIVRLHKGLLGAV